MLILASIIFYQVIDGIKSHTTNTSKLDILKALVHVNDMAPTFLEYANVSHPGTEFKGKQVVPMVGKSIKPLLEGKVDKVHADDEMLFGEMIGNAVILMDDWKARKNRNR